MKRLFAAFHINPGSEILDFLKKIQKELDKEKISWVKPENMHITLKFFGDIQEVMVDPIIRALDKAAGNLHSFDVSVEGFGIFGTTRFPKVLWLGLEYQSGLTGLYNAINHELEPLGFFPDKPVFKPHLTIARVKEIKNPDILLEYEGEYQDLIFQRNTIHDFRLYQSILKPSGPFYKTLYSFRLKS
jgi:RNA 2',3'-cyclic 3'-phosphodiesterase